MFHTRFQTEQQHRDTRCADIPSPWSPSAWFKLQMQANGDRNYPRDPDEALAEARHIMDHYFKLYQREGRTSDAPLADTLNPRFLSDHYLAHDEIAAMTPRDPGLNINGKTRKTIGELKKFQAVLRRERYEVAQNEVMVYMIIEGFNWIVFLVAWAVFLGFGLWMGGFLMRQFVRGMGWKDNSSGVFRRGKIVV